MVDPVNGAAQSLQDVTSSLDNINISADRVAASLTGAFARAAASGKAFDATLQGVLGNLSKMALNMALPPLQQGLSALTSAAFGGGGGGSGVELHQRPPWRQYLRPSFLPLFRPSFLLTHYLRHHAPSPAPRCCMPGMLYSSPSSPFQQPQLHS